MNPFPNQSNTSLKDAVNAESAAEQITLLLCAKIIELKQTNSISQPYADTLTGSVKLMIEEIKPNEEYLKVVLESLTAN